MIFTLSNFISISSKASMFSQLGERKGIFGLANKDIQHYNPEIVNHYLNVLLSQDVEIGNRSTTDSSFRQMRMKPQS